MNTDSIAMQLGRGALQAGAVSIAVALAAAYGGQAHAAGPNSGASCDVIAIDQAKAGAGGVTAGDAPVTNAGQGAICAGVKMDGNACNGQPCH